MTKPLPRLTDQERCDLHLADLVRAHKSPPADVRVRQGMPRFIYAGPLALGGSPAGWTPIEAMRKPSDFRVEAK